MIWRIVNFGASYWMLSFGWNMAATALLADISYAHRALVMGGAHLAVLMGAAAWAGAYFAITQKRSPTSAESWSHAKIFTICIFIISAANFGLTLIMFPEAQVFLRVFEEYSLRMIALYFLVVALVYVGVIRIFFPVGAAIGLDDGR